MKFENFPRYTLIVLMLAQMGVAVLAIPHLPHAGAQVNAVDMLMEVPGYTLSADIYNYPEYVTLMTELSIEPSDFILGVDPVAIILASYQRGDVYVWLEVFEFASEEDVEEEYALQLDVEEYVSGLGYQGLNGPMFQRFVPRERVFTADRFLFLLFYSPLDNMEAYGEMDRLLPSFISHFLDQLGTSIPKPPTAVEARWGLEPGDVLTWHVEGSTFTGYIGGGTSSSQGDWDGTWEIVDVRDGHLLVKQKRRIRQVLTEDETKVSVDIPYDEYTWYAPDEEGIPLRSEDGSAAGAVVYPLEYRGLTLYDFVSDSISNLPERDMDESTEYVSAHGRTPSYSGFTPIDTQWRDVVAHRGTGIITSYEFYYNNNEYSITTSTGITLTEANFDLSSRASVAPSLAASTTLSSENLTEGDPITLTVEIMDQDGAPVDDAEVTATFIGESYVLMHTGSGSYEATLSSDDADEGTYEVIISAEMTGYEGTSDSSYVVIQHRPPSQPAGSTPGGSGIPGFPPLAIALGMSLAYLVASQLRQ